MMTGLIWRRLEVFGEMVENETFRRIRSPHLHCLLHATHNPIRINHPHERRYILDIIAASAIGEYGRSKPYGVRSSALYQ